MKFIRVLKSSTKIESAVKDLPQDLVEAINNYAHGGMKATMDELYRDTGKDLNQIELSSDTITKTDKVRSSDLFSKDRAVFILISDGSRKTLVLADGRYYPQVLGGDVEFEVNGKYLDIRNSDRNVARVLNNYPYQAWVIDLSKAEDMKSLRDERYKSQQGIEERHKPTGLDGYYGYDLSGYKIDRNKYKDKLRKLRQENNEYTNQLIELYSQLSEAFNKRMLLPKDKRGSSWDLRNAFKEFAEAIDYAETDYSSPETIQKYIDKVKTRIQSLKK